MHLRVSQNTFIWIDPDSTDFIMCVLATTHPEDGGAVHMVIPSQTFANRRTFAKFAKPSTTWYVPSRSLNLRKYYRVHRWVGSRLTISGPHTTKRRTPKRGNSWCRSVIWWILRVICENHSPREAFPRVMIVFSMVSFFFIASESPNVCYPWSMMESY